MTGFHRAERWNPVGAVTEQKRDNNGKREIDTMKTAAIIGAGNIGRGFIGQVFSEGDYEVVYIDVVEKTVNALNESHAYPLELVSSTGAERRLIQNVRAVNGNDRAAAARTIADCDICVTCVGAKAIKFVIPNIAAGVRLRYSESGRPLDLLICENLMDADQYIHSLLKEELTEAELASVGLVETSVGRMVPLPDQALLEKEPLLVRAEPYGVLPCDKDAFKGEIPAVGNLLPVSPFRFMIERKLYVHNMGHAVCAYLGKQKGYKYIWQAIGDPAIRLTVREAMIESAMALSQRYGQPLRELLCHSGDLIRRFANRSLGDTCERVGADIRRKLAPTDRLTGAARAVMETGGHPVFIALGAAAALRQFCLDEGGDPAARLAELSGETEGEYYAQVLRFYDLLIGGAELSDLFSQADHECTKLFGRII